MARSHYDILQIQPNATADEIQHAYRVLAMRYHPDRNSSPDAATKMAAINEAYESLRDGIRPKARPASHESPIQGTGLNLELAVSVLSAARAMILRQGWTTVHEDQAITLFTFGKSSAKIALVDRLASDSLIRIMRRFGGLTAVLAVRIEGRLVTGATVTVVDLMRAERHGATVPEGPCKTLLSAFL